MIIKLTINNYLTAARSSLGFLATFRNSESDMSESESEESIIALDFTLSDSMVGMGRTELCSANYLILRRMMCMFCLIQVQDDQY